MSCSFTVFELKICFISAGLRGAYGGERHLLNLASELAAIGHEVTIYTHKINPICRSILSKKVKLVETGFPVIRDHDLALLTDLILMPYLVLMIRGKYDQIHAAKWQSVFGMALAKSFHPNYKKTPTVYHCQDAPRALYDLKNWTLTYMPIFKRMLLTPISVVLECIDKWSVRHADIIIANSDRTAKEIKRIYGRNSHIVYPGIEIERFGRYSKQEAREKLGIPLDLEVFISVSKLHRRKRIDRAVKIYADRCDGIRSSKFFIIGDGPERAKLQRLVSEMGIDNIKFLGELTDKDVELYYAASDCFIFTAKDEAFGLAPLEAKVAGCEIIGNHVQYPITSWRAHAIDVTRICEIST